MATKGLTDAFFGCVASKGLSGAFFVSVAGKGLTGFCAVAEGMVRFRRAYRKRRRKHQSTVSYEVRRCQAQSQKGLPQSHRAHREGRPAWLRIASRPIPLGNPIHHKHNKGRDSDENPDHFQFTCSFHGSVASLRAYLRPVTT